LTRLNPVIILFPEVPAKNIVKTYIADCYYHAYNRGVDKRIIFLDDQDYRVFLHLLKIYLSPKSKENPPLTRLNLVRPRPVQSVSGEVQLIAYCLMPNHFHLLRCISTIDIKESELCSKGFIRQRLSTQNTISSTYPATFISTQAN